MKSYAKSIFLVACLVSALVIDSFIFSPSSESQKKPADTSISK